MSVNQLTHLPRALAGAAALRTLAVSHNWQLRLEEEDAGLLGPLPQLQVISFPGAPAGFRGRVSTERLRASCRGLTLVTWMRTSGRSTSERPAEPSWWADGQQA